MMRAPRLWGATSWICTTLLLAACGVSERSAAPDARGKAKLSADVSVLAYTPNLRVRLFAVAASGGATLGEQVVQLDTPGSDEVAVDVDLTTCASGAAGTCSLTLQAQMLDPQGSVLDQVQSPPFTLSPGERSVLTDPLVLREVARVVVTPATLDLEVGQTRQLTAVAQNVLGQAVVRPAPAITVSAPSVVTISPTLLATAVGAGAATATFTIGGRSATLAIQTRTPPRIAVAPTTLAFTRTVGDTTTATAAVAVTNTGQASLTGLVATVGAGAPWLSATLGGTTAPAQMTINANARGLAAGTYNGTVTLSVAGRTDIPAVSLTVALTVLPSSQIALTPARIVFRAAQGGPLPGQQGTQITEPNGRPLTGLSIRSIIDSVTGLPADVSWLNFSLSSAQAPTTLFVTVNTTQPVGTRRVRFEIASSAPGVTNSPQFLDVRYDVVAADSLIATPASLQFAAAQAAALPAAQQVTLTSSGSAISGLTVASVSQPFLTATLNGTVTPTSVVIRPNTTTLTPGTYNATVTIRSIASSVAPSIVIPVTYVIDPASALTGRVFNGATGSGLAGATVTAILGSVVTATSTTSAQGTYSLTLPLGTGYRLSVTAAGFTSAGVLGVDVGPTTTNAPAVPLAPSGSLPGTITGTARSATTGLALGAGVAVELRPDVNNLSGTVTAATQTITSGQFLFANVAPGTYTLVARAPGFSNGTATAVSLSGSSSTQDVLLSPTLAAGAVRIVLTWGNQPPDLDAHLTYPAGSGRGWVYFEQAGTCGVDPVCLDVDQQQGFGPETITISSVSPGVYRYYVNNFSQQFDGIGGPLSASNAVVQVFQAGSNAPVRSFAAPQLPGTMWHVFDLSGTTITAVNQMISFDPTVPLPRVAPGFSTAGRFLTDADIMRALFSVPRVKPPASPRLPGTPR